MFADVRVFGGNVLADVRAPYCYCNTTFANSLFLNGESALHLMFENLMELLLRFTSCYES